MKRILLTLSLAALATSSAFASDTLVLTDSAVHTVTDLAARDSNTLELALSDGASAAVTLDSIRALASLPAPPRLPRHPVVRLRNGECFTGALSWQQEQLTITLPGDSPVEFSRDDLQSIRYTGVVLPSDPNQVPGVVTRNGDIVSGEIRSIAPGGVNVASLFGDIQLEQANIGALLFAPDDIHPSRAPSTWLLEWSDGTRVYAESARLSADGNLVAVREGQELPARSVSDLVRLAAPGWQMLPLDADERPDCALPIGDPASPPAWLAGRRLQHGLALKAPCMLEMVLPSDTRAVFGWLGLDTHLGRTGDCRIEVMCGETTCLDRRLTSADESVSFNAMGDGMTRWQLQLQEGSGGPYGDRVNVTGFRLVPLAGP